MSRVTDFLTKRELRALNDELEPLGVRVCRACQGKPLPLTTDHFYPAQCRYGLNTICKRCHNARCVARAKQRYHEDPAFHQMVSDQQRRYRLRHAASYGVLMQRSSEQQRRATFARILEGAKP